MMMRYHVVPMLALLFFSPVTCFQSLQGQKVKTVTGEPVDIGSWLSQGEKRLVIFGTYAADFNAIEYGQRLRYYWPVLEKDCGVKQCAFLLNCQPAAATKLRELELWVDNEGSAGRAFGVERGWLPDNKDVNPFIKLFGMLWGLGAWATLPAVIGGYIGNPFTPQPWIEDALCVGQQKGRWPDTALELDNGVVATNKFKELPAVGGWERRPLELATLRLQSMLGISLASWEALAPDEAALDAGVLTQLGGCLVVDEEGKELFKWRDPGICAVANFEDMVKALSG